MGLDITGLGAISDLANTVVNKIWPDKTEQEKAQIAFAAQQVVGQLDINKTEATNPSVFVSGWRPSVGWVCSAGLAYSFIGQPLLAWASSYYHIPSPPSLDMGTLFTVLGGMLGLGGLRTVEKVNGVAAK